MSCCTGVSQFHGYAVIHPLGFSVFQSLCFNHCRVEAHPKGWRLEPIHLTRAGSEMSEVKNEFNS